MNHYKALTMNTQNTIVEGYTPDVTQFMVSVVKELASKEVSSPAIAVICDGKIAFQVRHFVLVGQDPHISVKAVDTPATPEHRGALMAALYRSAEEAEMRGSYEMANRLKNQASVLAHSPLAHPQAAELAKQAIRLLAKGVAVVSKMTSTVLDNEAVLAIEQIEVNGTLAKIEGELLSLSYMDKHGLLEDDLNIRVVQLGTAVANLVIGTQYRHNRIANEVINLGERLYGNVWIDALLRA